MVVVVLHSEAIEFLDEIAINNPELLQSASYIDLKTTIDDEVEIIIHCRIASCDLEQLNRLVSAWNFKVLHFPIDVWVIK